LYIEASCSVDCLLICMLYAAVKRRQERAFCGLALRRTSTDKVHHGEHQCHPASDCRLSGIDSQLSMRELHEHVFHLRSLFVDSDVSARLGSALVVPGLLQRCSCRSYSDNTGSTAESPHWSVDLLVSVADIPTRPSLRASRNGELF